MLPSPFLSPIVSRELIAGRICHDEELKKTLQEGFDKEDKAAADEQAEADKVQQEKDRAEEERIKALKESGEYYYGYKVFGDDGKDPNEYERSEQENMAWEAGTQFADALGLEGGDKLSKRVSMLQSLGSAVSTATPAWIAAAAGLAGAGLLAGQPARILAMVIGAAALWGLYWLLRRGSSGALGAGDVRLAGLLGTVLGFDSLWLLLWATAAAFVLGGLAALVVVVRDHGDRVRDRVGHRGRHVRCEPAHQPRLRRPRDEHHTMAIWGACSCFALLVRMFPVRTRTFRGGVIVALTSRIEPRVWQSVARLTTTAHVSQATKLRIGEFPTFKST